MLHIEVIVNFVCDFKPVRDYYVKGERLRMLLVNSTMVMYMLRISPVGVQPLYVFLPMFRLYGLNYKGLPQERIKRILFIT